MILFKKPFNLYNLKINLIGGAEEDRTPDPLRARQVLSQLSYDPSFFAAAFCFTLRCLRARSRPHTGVCSLVCLLRRLD